MDFFKKASNNTIEGIDMQFNSDGWGPVIGEQITAFDDVPYAHFDKKDKCSRPADFIQNNYNNQQKYRPRYEMGSTNAEFAYRHDNEEDKSFQLVDTSKAPNKYKNSNVKRTYQQKNIQRGGNIRSTGKSDQHLSFGKSTMARKGSLNDRGGRGRTGRGGMRRQKTDRMPSLTVGAEWEMVEEFDLAQLLKLVANPPQVEDLMWCGHLDQYDENIDKVNIKSAKPLKSCDNKIFYYVTSQEDPILEKFCAEELGEVYATDAILSHLMASPRSVYSWDLVIEKIGGIIFIDKREDSLFDYLTVSETAHEPPSTSDENDEINHPEKLSFEATKINQNFCQQVLKEDENRKNYDPNPFYDDTFNNEGEPASVAYRYRKFTLGNIRIVARCELHAWLMSKKNEEQLMTVYALNEWDSKYSGGVNWRQKIDQQQRGAVLATELKNNSNKLAKWTAQSILAGADLMKLGFVSRVGPTNAYDHVILETQTFKPKEIAAQTNLSINNMWGIVKMIAELLLKKEDGKYVLMKDPNKATVRLYSIPEDAFEVDADEIGEFFKKTFVNQIFIANQKIVMKYKDVQFSAIVTKIEHIDLQSIATPERVTSASSDKSRGQLSMTTTVIWSKQQGAANTLIITGGAGGTARNDSLFQADFDFEKLGIGGLGAQFQTMFRRAFASRLFPGVYKDVGINHIKGMILFGPPGCGKTLIARKIGKVLNAHEPIIVNGPELISSYQGKSEENVRDLFKPAEEEQRELGDASKLHIIIFDEMDALMKKRGSTSGGTGVDSNIVNQLLTKIDGVDSLNNILIIGMTNRLDLIDEAILRPGRLELHIEIALPDVPGRQQIINIHTQKLKDTKRIKNDVVDMLPTLAELTKNYTGAEIEGLIKNAFSFAIARNVDPSNIKTANAANISVEWHDIERALRECVPAFGSKENEEIKGHVRNGICSYGSAFDDLWTNLVA